MTLETSTSHDRRVRLARRAVAAGLLALGSLGVVSRVSTFSAEYLRQNDFTQDYLSAKAWREGKDPYTETAVLLRATFGRRAGYYGLVPAGQRDPHPPSFIALHIPFSLLGYRSARVAWLLVMAGLGALGVGMVARQLGAKTSTAAVLGIGALGLPIFQKDLLYAQSNGLLLVLIVSAWRDLRREREARAGLALGVAAALKLFPAFLVIPLIRDRRWRALSWAAGAAVGVTALGALTLGASATTAFARAVAQGNFEYWRSAPMNIPLVAVPYRWLTASPWRPDALNLSIVAASLSLGAFALCVTAAARTPGQTSGDRFLEALPWMLLATPIVWDSYLTLLVPLVLSVVARLRIEGLLRRPLLGAALAVVLVGAPPGLPAPQLAADIHQVLGYALPTYALLILGVIGWRHTRGRARDAVEQAA